MSILYIDKYSSNFGMQASVIIKKWLYERETPFTVDGLNTFLKYKKHVQDVSWIFSFNFVVQPTGLPLRQTEWFKDYREVTIPIVCF